ncbi:MAG: LmeA family phospholipid-binding protein [Solirubrobacteraceae bacterium]
MARIAVGAGVAIVVLLVLAQLLAPGIAARVVRGKVEKYGSVKSVQVKAWPAVKLAWRHADEVRVSAGRLKFEPDQAVALLKEAKGTDRVRTSVESVEVNGLRLTGAKFEKHGSALRAEAVISEEDIKRALPEGFEVALVKSEGGTVEVRASGGLFGVGASVDAVAQAEDGKLVARPTGLLLSALKLTLFENPSLYVEGVEARALADGQGEGARYELSMWASLR